MRTRARHHTSRRAGLHRPSRRTTTICSLAGVGAVVGLALPDLRAYRRLSEITHVLREPGTDTEQDARDTP
jgi:hypothetical protein